MCSHCGALGGWRFALASLLGKNVAVAWLMEARMKEEGIESFKAPGSDTDVTVISSAANKMGGLGCAIVINEEIPWRFDDEKPRYLKGESCSIVVAWPRFLLASCNDEVYKGYFLVVHIPQRNCKEMDASLFVSNVVRKIKKQVKDNANMMFFIDANATGCGVTADTSKHRMMLSTALLRSWGCRLFQRVVVW